jgi:hypothetical protein
VTRDVTGIEDEQAETAEVVCGCDSCPDLAAEEFSRCCKSVSKTLELCTKSALACICKSPKLGKLLDKERI